MNYRMTSLDRIVGGILFTGLAVLTSGSKHFHKRRVSSAPADATT